ncbi:enoyl-CoA hydratase/carnithine racemase [Mycena olivaceomarginata]|nr:enoyl-CoA hydratase/carnithine racemase [Mycena olivaceomarginata]
MSPTLNPPAVSGQLLVSFPKEHVLQLTLNRPKSLNASTPQMMDDVRKVLNWFEDETELVAWNQDEQRGQRNTAESVLSNIYGFASISRRTVNGHSFGGGTELVLNCDLVVASKDANFGLPEVKRGVVAIQGGIPRLARIAGHQLASEMLLLGKTITADDARNRFGLCSPPTDVLPTALDLASQIIANSPDSEGLRAFNEKRNPVWQNPGTKTKRVIGQMC